MTVGDPPDLRPIALGLLCDALLDEPARARGLARVVSALNPRTPPEARLEADGLAARFAALGRPAAAPSADGAPPWEAFAWRVFEAFLERAPRPEGPHLAPVFEGLDPDAWPEDDAHELIHFVSSYEYCGSPAAELRRVIGLTLLDARRTYDAPSRSWPRAWRAASPGAPALAARIDKRGGLVLSWPEGPVDALLARWAPPPDFAPHAAVARELVRWVTRPPA